MEKLAEITRLSAEHFKGKTKLYCIHLFVGTELMPEELKKLLSKYWQEVEEQLLRLEATGKINKVFCESVLQDSPNPLQDISRLGEDIYRIVKKKTDQGATVIGIEKKEIYEPFIDWMHCLSVVRSKEAYERVSSFYIEYAHKRIASIQSLIEESLNENEAGMLIMNADDRAKLQLPSSIEVFLVTPPSYDDILRWFRDNLIRQKAKETEQ